jgi:23S rRNA pseudouridine1911/1915/1917 synthase
VATDERRRVLPPATEGPLLAWLLATLEPTPRTRVKQLLARGQVTVNGTPVKQFDHPLAAGDQVAIAHPSNDPASQLLRQAGVTIVYQDDDLVVIDKPAGLLSVATSTERVDTAFARLNAYLDARREGRPFVVHRLDRETSGLLLFARSAGVRDRLQARWHQVRKTYIAIVEGSPAQTAGIVDNYLLEGRDMRVRSFDRPGAGRKRAVTHYRVLSQRANSSLLRVELETGRKHQIRVHLAGLGCPVIGDPIYGKKSDPARRLGLHAARLSFHHPVTEQRLELEAELPNELRHGRRESKSAGDLS